LSPLEGTEAFDALADAVAARVLASLQASKPDNVIPLNAPRSKVITVGRLTIDEDRFEVFVDGVLVEGIKPQEFRLLRLLAINAGRVLNRPQILELAWPDDAYLTHDERVVDVMVHRLRKRLQDRASIRCVPRTGYKLVDR
jgi:DNA-binding response OmpR family regulator